MGKISAINNNHYFIPLRTRRQIKAKSFQNCETKNIIDRHQNLNNKCYKLLDSNSCAYKTHFFQRQSLSGTRCQTTLYKRQVLRPSRPAT